MPGAGLFIYAYTFYYYLARSDMSGFMQVCCCPQSFPLKYKPSARSASLMGAAMQASFYFGYMFVVCYAFFLMLGTIGYRASLTFVRHIYRAIKCE